MNFAELALYLPENFQTTFFWENSIASYIVALAITIVLLAALQLFKVLVLNRLRNKVKRKEKNLSHLIVGMIASVKWPLYLLTTFGIIGQTLFIHPRIVTVYKYILYFSIAYYAVKSLQELIMFVARIIKEQRKENQEDEDNTVIDLLTMLAKGVLWIVALLLVLENLGFTISTLLAGIGIGGLAIAFALQNVLSDIFASISIYFDKPFQKGDFIIIGTDMGVVQKIGIKTTRIRTLQGEELVVSNQELTSTRVRNFKKMEKRRIVFSVGVVYSTTSAKLKKIPTIITDIINKKKQTVTDRVHFKAFGDWALLFETVYYLDNQDYNVYMDVQQAINLEIKAAFEKAKIEMAFPTQTVHVQKGK